MLFLEINIEIQDIGRNLVGPQPRGDFPQPGLRLITETRLLKTKRPQGREGRKSREPAICTNNLFGIRAAKHVIVDGTTFGPKRINVAFDPAEVKAGRPGIFQQDAYGAT